jgi:cobalt/nickel transport system permease protein
LENAMHIPDGMLSAPVAGTAAVLAAGGIVLAVKKTRKDLGEQQIPILGVTAAFIYAAQMLNFPVLAGTSGHFLGAFLAAVLLGPWAGFLVISLVLTVQCLLHGDGGLGALGANILNMGGVGAILTYALFAFMKRILPASKEGAIASAGIAAWASVFMASALCSLEVVISGNLTYPAAAIFGSMLGVHTLIGVGEAIITVSVVSLVLASRPDLVSGITLEMKAQEA